MYWEETAKEYISSAGAVFDLGKCRSFKGYYRSPYLDRLRVEAQKFTSKFEALPSIHPCIHGYMSEMEFGDRSLYPKIRERIEEKKSAECIEQDISAALWTGLKRELNLILDEFALLGRFDIIKTLKNRSEFPTIIYGLTTSNGLLFYFHVDNGVRERLLGLLPIQFWIGHNKITEDDFFVADFRYIIPGFEQYAYYSTPENAILGVRALVCAFDALMQSF